MHYTLLISLLSVMPSIILAATSESPESQVLKQSLFRSSFLDSTSLQPQRFLNHTTKTTTITSNTTNSSATSEPLPAPSRRTHQSLQSIPPSSLTMAAQHPSLQYLSRISQAKASAFSPQTRASCSPRFRLLGKRSCRRNWHLSTMRSTPLFILPKRVL